METRTLEALTLRFQDDAVVKMEARDRRLARRAREVVLRDALWRLRMALKLHRQAFGEYPTEIRDLVSHGVCRSLPVDPFTSDRESWTPVYSFEMEPEAEHPPPPVVVDVHSGAPGLALNGVPYAEW